MLAKFMRKAHISALVTPSWVAACFVALAVLGTSTPVAMADCSPLGTWHGQWNSYDGASGSLDITIDCDGHVVGTMEWDMRPDVDCVLYFDIDTTYPPLPPGCYRGYCFEDTEYCLGIPVTLSIYSEGVSTSRS